MELRERNAEEIRYAIGDDLIRCGIDPESLDLRQLKTAESLIAAIKSQMEKRNEAKSALDSIRLDKTTIATKAGITRTYITESQSPVLEKIYTRMTDTPKKTTDDRLANANKEIARLKRELAAQDILQLRLGEADETIRKKENTILSLQKIISQKDKQIENYRKWMESQGKLENMEADIRKAQEEEMKRAVSDSERQAKIAFSFRSNNKNGLDN